MSKKWGKGGGRGVVSGGPFWLIPFSILHSVLLTSENVPWEVNMNKQTHKLNELGLGFEAEVHNSFLSQHRRNCETAMNGWNNQAWLYLSTAEVLNCGYILKTERMEFKYQSRIWSKRNKASVIRHGELKTGAKTANRPDKQDESVKPRVQLAIVVAPGSAYDTCSPVWTTDQCLTSPRSWSRHAALPENQIYQNLEEITSGERKHQNRHSSLFNKGSDLKVLKKWIRYNDLMVV